MLHTNTQRKKALWKGGILFLAQVGVFTGLLFLLFQPMEFFLQELTATHAQFVLHVLGTATVSQDAIQFWAGNNLVEISSLCAGLLEMILLVSAMLATDTVSLEKKMKGIIAGVILLYAFNIFRIVITVQQLVHTSLSFAEFTHDVFFRLMLLVGFAAIYAAWLNFGKIRGWGRAKGLFA